MNQMVSIAILALCGIAGASAQDVGFDRVSNQRAFESMMQEFLGHAPSREDQAGTEAAKRYEAQMRERQFIEKVNRFVELWTSFATEYNEQRVFNIRSAKEISKAFHDLEGSEG